MKKTDFRHEIKSWLNNNCDIYHNYCQFKKDAKDALELDSDMDIVFDKMFDEIAEDHFLKEIGRKYDFPFGVGLGISHINTPYKYFVEFIENDVVSIDELKKKIEKHTTPYAFGTLASGSWGNFWFEVIKNKDDLKRIKKEHTQYYYLTFLCVLATHGNHA